MAEGRRIRWRRVQKSGSPSGSDWGHQSLASLKAATVVEVAGGLQAEADGLAGMIRHAAHWNKSDPNEKTAKEPRMDPCWDGDAAGMGPDTEPVGRAKLNCSTF